MRHKSLDEIINQTAKIIDNSKKKNKLFQDVAVKILTDVNHLYYVFVIQ